MSYRDEVLADSPVAYWRLGEPVGATVARDEMGAHPGTLSGLVVTGLGAGGGLAGDDDTALICTPSWQNYVTVPDAPDLRPQTITVEGLLNGSTTARYLYVCRKSLLGSYMLRYDITTGFATAAMNLSGTVQVVSGAVNLADTAWHHLAATYDGTTLALYVDGALVASGAFPGALTYDAGALTFGANPAGPEWAYGRVDEVAVYAHVLPAQRIIAHSLAALQGARAGTPPLTVVKLRAPEPPHAEIATLLPTALTYGRMLMRRNTASFRLSRKDAAWTDWAGLLVPDGAPPMFTIERADGLHTWAGFLTRVNMRRTDTDVEFQLADHAWRLEHARAQKSGTVTGAGGDVLVSALREMDQRGEPPLYIDVAGVTGGPDIDYTFRADQGLDLLNKIAGACDYEWGWAHQVSAGGVRTQLIWTERIGQDRRGDVVLKEDRDLTDVQYALDYGAAIASAVVVGGTGAFGARPAVSVSKTGASSAGVSGRALTASAPFGLGGSRVLIEQQVTDPAALFAAAQRMHAAPQALARTIAFSVYEPAVDMARLGVGDIVSTSLAATRPGMPIAPDVRILGINYEPATSVHKITAEVV